MSARKTAKASTTPTVATWTPADDRKYSSNVSYGVDRSGTVSAKPVRS
jgi:hypothetical protein